MIRSFLFAGLIVTTITGCATVNTIKSWIPSFWDDNQSSKIIDVRQSIAQLDCQQDYLPQIKRIRDNLQWFELYSESKGWQQKDVLRVIKPIQDTVADFYKRGVEQQGSTGYCELKKKILATQADHAARAVLGRF